MSSKLEKIIRAKEVANGHRIGLSRRELLSHGVFSFSALVTASPLALLTKKAWAADRQADENPIVPFMCFDMAGGAALPGSFLVGKRGGPEELLASYSTLGWNPRAASTVIDRRFGLPMAGISGFFQGLTQTMSPAAQALLRLGSVCHFSQLDSGENRQNIAGLANRLGSVGSVIGSGLGTVRNQSGGRSAQVEPNLAAPSYVANVDHFRGLLNFGGGMLSDWSRESLAELLSSVKSLSADQIQYLRNSSGGPLLEQKVRDFVNDTSPDIEVDARRDAAAREVWNIQENTRPDNDIVVQASISRATIEGISGPSVWTLGGCDYHDQTSTTGDARDLDMGRAIGRAVEYAHRRGKPLFFQLITDGSCDSRPGTRIWTGDTNEGMQVFGYYQPGTAPRYRQQNMQVGHFNDSQAAERSTLVGSDPRKASLVSFANYCNVQGRLDQFTRLFPAVFSREELESILVFDEA